VRLYAVVRVAAALALCARGAWAQGTAGDSGSPRPGIERLRAVVQQRLQLTDDQTARLRETSQRYAEQRKALLRDERDARRTVRDEVSRGDAADQPRVQSALDRLYATQQRRTELAASEQRELAGFLTPTQRAQYAGMQERAFRAAQEIRQRRDAAGLTRGLPPARPEPGAAPDVQRRAERQQEHAQEQQRRRQERQAARRAARAAAHRPR